MASVTGVVTVPSSSGSVACTARRAIRRWFFGAFCRTLGIGGVLGNEWRSLAGFTLLYRGTTCFSTSPGTHPRDARFHGFEAAAPLDGKKYKVEWMVMDSWMSDSGYDKAHASTSYNDKYAPRDLQQVLAHEMDHIMFGDTDLTSTNRSWTKYSQQCSGLQ